MKIPKLFLKGKEDSNRKSKETYSQCGEDIIIEFIFNSLNIKNIKYLDIGTNDPIYNNNTYLFYQKGGCGVCVEPDETLFSQIRKLRPRDISLQVGISDDCNEKKAKLYIMNARTMSTFSEQEAKNLTKYDNFKIETIKQVTLLPVNKILKQYFQGSPHLISLDAEGFDFKIIKSIDFTKFRPHVICIETLTYSQKNDEYKEKEIIEYMERQGYFVYADTYINSIFVEKYSWLKRQNIQ